MYRTTSNIILVLLLSFPLNASVNHKIQHVVTESNISARYSNDTHGDSKHIPCLHQIPYNTALVPDPQCIKDKKIILSLDRAWTIMVDTTKEEDTFTAQWLASHLASSASLALNTLDLNTEGSSGRIVLGKPTHPMVQQLLEKHKITLPSSLDENEGYFLEVFKNEILIVAPSAHGLFNGVQTLIQLINKQASLRGVEIIDYPDQKVRAVMVASGASKLYLPGDADHKPIFGTEQKKAIDRLARFKINTIMYTDRGTDFFRGPEYLAVYQEVASYCRKRFIDFIPSIASLRNLLGFPFDLYEGWWVRDESLSFGKNNLAHPKKPFSNILSNGDFELDANDDGIPDEWILSGDGSGSLENTDVYNGKSSLKIDSGSAYAYREHTVDPGYYYFSVWVKGEKPSISLSIQDKAGNATFSMSDSANAQHTWKKAGVIIKADKSAKKVITQISGKGLFDDARLYRINGGLKNVIRAPTTDIEVTDTKKKIIYREGTDYAIIDGETSNTFDEGLKSFQIKRLQNGSIPKRGGILVSYDAHMFYARSNIVNQPPVISDPRLFEEYYYPAIDKVISKLRPKIIHFHSDEIAGINRDSRNLKRKMSNAELFAEWLNKIVAYVKSKDPNCRVMIWDDMISPYHNGRSESYQAGYGGASGRMDKAADLISKEVILSSWWYSDTYLTQMHDSIQFFSKKGFSYLGSPWYITRNIESWSQLLAGFDTSLGGMVTEWWNYPGWEHQIDKHYSVFADHFWNTRRETIFFDGFEHDDNNDGLPDGWTKFDSSIRSPNLLKNASFERGFDGWEFYEQNKPPELDSQITHDGTKSAYFNSPSISAGSAISADNYITVKPGQRYILKACAKAQDVKTGNVKWWHKLLGSGYFYDRNHQTPQGDPDYMLDIDFASGTNDWICSTVEKRAPEDASFFKLTSIGIRGSGTGKAWVDAISFRKHTPKPYDCRGDGWQQGTTYEGYSKCAVSTQKELTSWQGPAISVEPENQYFLSVYAKRKRDEKGAQPWIKVIWLDDSKKVLSISRKQLQGITSRYELFEMESTPPKEAHYAQIYLAGANDGSDYFVFDSVRLQKKLDN